MRSDDELPEAETSERMKKHRSGREIETGSSTGEIVGIGSVQFGQEFLEGPPRQSVEFSHVNLAVSMKQEKGRP